MNVLRASIRIYGALKTVSGTGFHENRLMHSSAGGVGRVIEMLEVRCCSSSPVKISASCSMRLLWCGLCMP